MGAMIDTQNGPCAIEDLRVGDLVQTRDDGLQVVQWIGSTKVSGRDLWMQPRLRPVAIAANALGQGVPALHLIGQPGIAQDQSLQGVQYYHIAFDRHQIVRSDGAWSESFLQGAQALSGMSAAIQAELEVLFGDQRQDAARLCLKHHEAKVLLAA